MSNNATNSTGRIISMKQKRLIFWNKLLNLVSEKDPLYQLLKQSLTDYQALLFNWSENDSLSPTQSIELSNLERTLGDIDNEIRLKGKQSIPTD
jgi:hypothetical protein